MNTQPQLTYNKTKIKHDIDWYLGKTAFFKFIVTDMHGNRYENEFDLKKDWTMKIFTEAFTFCLLMCDAMPVSIHLDEISLVN